SSTPFTRLTGISLRPHDFVRSTKACSSRAAQIARSGLAVLAQEPHRTTRHQAVSPSTEPAFCVEQGEHRCADLCAVIAWSGRRSACALWAAPQDVALGAGTAKSSLACHLAMTDGS